MSEFIGSRISLISKSDIRYVGTLHEINSESSTVALGQVTSFGTEGRRNNPDDELPASDHVYEYIVFRGSDVKDLRIEEPPKDNNPPPPEPQSGSRPQQPHVPSQQGDQSRNGPGPSAFQPQSSFPPYQQYGQYQQQGFRGPYGAPQHDFGPPAPFQGYGPSPYGGPQRWGGMPPYQQGFHPPPSAFSPNHPNMMFGPPGMPPNPDPSRGPVPPSQQSPPEGKPAAGPEQASNGRPAIEGQPSGPTASTNPLPAVAQGPPPPMSSKPDVAAAIAPPISNVDPMAIRKPAAAPAAPMSGKIIPAIPFAKKPLASTGMTKTAPVAVASHATGTQAATAAVAAAMAKLGPAPGQQKPISSRSNNDSEAAMDNLTRKVNAMRTDERIRHSDQPGTGGFAAGNRGGRGRAARGGRGRGAHRDSTGHGQVRPLDVPTTDFDFESANAKFNKQDLVKEAIATGEPSDGNIDTSTAAANGDANYNGDQAASKSTGDVVIPSAPPTYDKSSSFFDNISSEAKERESSAADGRRGGGREFRTEERKRNMETFGLGSVDSYRGGRRGRGRGRGFGRGTFRGRGNMAEFAINGGPGAEA